MGYSPLEEKSLEIMAEASSKGEGMSKEHRVILKRSRAELEPNLQALQLLPHLSIILTQEDEEDVKAETTEIARARKLLDILPRKGHSAFACFVDGLRKVQPHIAKCLSSQAGLEEPSSFNENDIQMMCQEHKDRLRCSRELLMNINIDDVLKLMEVVLTKMDIQLINSKSTHAEKLDEFISVLQRKEAKAFDHFVKVLGTLKRDDIVKCLTGQALHKASNKVSEHQIDGKLPIQVVGLDNLPHVEGVPIINILHKMDMVCVATNKDDQWKSLVKGTENLKIAAPRTIKDLNPNLSKQLHDVVLGEIKSKPDCSVSIVGFETYVIRDFTKFLRQNRLIGSIMWMKGNLPAGVTGPVLDEIINVREIPYKVRSPLTMELTADSNWKRLAERLGMEVIKTRVLDQRYKNPADEVLKDWETKRDSTVGALYDILVELEMPVIADKVL